MALTEIKSKKVNLTSLIAGLRRRVRRRGDQLGDQRLLRQLRGLPFAAAAGDELY